MNKIRDVLYNLTYAEAKALWAKHLLWAKENNRVSGTPKWFDEPGTLNVFSVDCDSNSNLADNEIEFNRGKYKDFLVLVFNKPEDKYDLVVIEVTVDPATDKLNRMNIMPGVYDAYQVGVHGISSGRTTTYIDGVGNVTRWALRQDRDKVFIARTDGSETGKVLKFMWDMCYSNVHDPNDFNDPGAGCTVTKTKMLWFLKLLPYLYDIVNHKYVPVNYKNITYAVMHFTQFESYTDKKVELEELAEAVDGVDGDTSGGAHSATREGVSK